MIGSRAGEERGDFTGCGRGCQATAVFGDVGRPEVHRTGDGTESGGAMRQTAGYLSRTFFPAKVVISYLSGVHCEADTCLGEGGRSGFTTLSHVPK